jgi:hypothetical protein
MTTAAMSGVPFKLQDATTTGNGNIICPPPSFRNHTLIVTSAAGVTAGAVQPEVSNYPTDAGTWAPIGGGPVTVPAASTDLLIEFTGLYAAIRARITTTISGGATPSVTVSYNGAKSY